MAGRHLAPVVARLIDVRDGTPGHRAQADGDGHGFLVVEQHRWRGGACRQGGRCGFGGVRAARAGGAETAPALVDRLNRGNSRLEVGAVPMSARTLAASLPETEWGELVTDGEYRAHPAIG
ncbi:hypothetical protein GCM10022419_080010 [Nonomuraea rosea]|uniref:Uncharacterized protein n=1 Tax=Nonomuraea rosea TaxID=638574 RepID=A0ABP6YLA8_9ACTN